MCHILRDEKYSLLYNAGGKHVQNVNGKYSLYLASESFTIPGLYDIVRAPLTCLLFFTWFMCPLSFAWLNMPFLFFCLTYVPFVLRLIYLPLFLPDLRALSKFLPDLPALCSCVTYVTFVCAIAVPRTWALSLSGTPCWRSSWRSGQWGAWGQASRMDHPCPLSPW